MSPASVAAVSTKTLPVCILGQHAHSPFRIGKLLAAIKAAGVGLSDEQSIRSRYLYAVHTTKALSAEEYGQLERLLGTVAQPEELAPALAQASILVVPRLGTVSPWSSKATDIARNCGLENVLRIERGVLYSMDGFEARRADERAVIASVLHDRMTESVVSPSFDASELFLAQSPRPLETIDVLSGGRDALQRTNVALGLALSEDEVEYLFSYFSEIARNPTDVELMMFAQANSEHCRHKIFNASWTIDGVAQDTSLFGMIRNTHAVSPHGTIVAYSDNSAVMQGATIERFHPDASGRYGFQSAETHVLMKVETHNHPTAIAPWPGAATGAGGEIRDEGATGRGAKPKAGLTGFSVSNLRIPGFEQPWEENYGKPSRIASALDIMIEGPLGGAAFNNEFGRINLCGYFRTYEQRVGNVVRGYHKPIMIAGGYGNIDARHTEKRMLSPGDLFIQLGGPGMRIGLGGGAASSVTSGANTEALDFDSVQRANAEMQRRCQEVIDACWRMGEANPILSIHDVGAGGISNALPELAHSGGVGAEFDLRQVPSIEPGMSPREIWSNESQERYVLAIAADALPAFTAFAARERCPFAVVGQATSAHALKVIDPLYDNAPVDMALDVLLGKPPRMHRDVLAQPVQPKLFALDDIVLQDAISRVLQFPTVADKSFLITIGDRSVGGLTARDQFVGPWQVPVADCAVTLMGFDTLRGEAMAMGERVPIATLDAPASGRMAVGEALTNLMAADVEDISDIKLSANWMAAAGYPGEDAALFRTVEAIGQTLCPALGIGIPVGKDSLSMRTSWRDEDGAKEVVAPVSLVISAFATVRDASATLTPQLARDGEMELVLIDLGGGKSRMGASVLAQAYRNDGGVPPDLDDPGALRAMFSAVRQLARDGHILAYHDRSDGGLLATLTEMMFASQCGVTLNMDGLVFDPRESDVDDYDATAATRKLGANAHLVAALFNEELGAVIQIRRADRAAVMLVLRNAGLGACCHVIGHPNDTDELKLVRGATVAYAESRHSLRTLWSRTSHLIQSMRDNPDTAKEELGRLLTGDGLIGTLTFDASHDVAAPYVSRGEKARPRVAILREQGVNGQVEMAHAFTRAGFEAVDVHMSDIIDGRLSLDSFHGLAACGGFSYGDVLGAGQGWAKSVLFNARARDVFARYFARTEVFALGVCNGCQMMSNLSELIPGAENWPRFHRNQSEQYEARTVALQIADSPSIFFAGMAGAVIPVPTAHGEGQAIFRDAAQQEAARWLCAARFVDASAKPTMLFPANPNGSPLGMTAFTTPDGRFNIMMPHPERAVLNVNLSWRPADWPKAIADGKPAVSPWMRMFRNARVWVG